MCYGIDGVFNNHLWQRGTEKTSNIIRGLCLFNVNAVRLEINNKFNVYNQATATVSIKELSVAIKNAAEDCGIKTEIQHIENPRVEKEEHKMTISNEKFMSLLGPQKYDIESGMRQVIKSLVPFKETIKTYKDSFISV